MLGDRDHTQRVARRMGLAAFALTLLILSPLAYGLVRAGSYRLGQFNLSDMILAGFIVVFTAVAAAFAASIAVHLLGREARARRRR
ncbi:hypothetical protein D1610_02285 [Sphingomonas gilva]|uniref:Uncharacterized protein n=1 Tax=Sphingomonas gilva TaxID=2305907 RepID=A0A396RZ17_9SPHN|nr:hypothetical protein D1610_02285 [Sphingomonas gilva]